MIDAPQRKQTLRAEVRARVASLGPAAKAEQSSRACQALLASPIFQAAHSILLYMPLPDEVDVAPMFEGARAAAKAVALPRFVPETGAYAAFFIGDKPLRAGPFQVLEPPPDFPVPLNRLDLLVVPGLGFDWRGARLGRGKGFYDRLLSEAAGVKCGICFDEQIVAGIPVEPHDVGVQYLATPSRWQDCRGAIPELK